jgi:threonylcarbamoyladenosine tRNA methylthiotransferase MtaB
VSGLPTVSSGTRAGPRGWASIGSLMATFTTGFLGCKVSQTDVREIRERLVADGHMEVQDAPDVAVVNTCCVTHEAVRKSRQAARRAARGAKRVYLTGCAANLQGDALAGLPENVTVVRLPGERTPAFVARDVGPIGCVRADVGLDRIRAFVKVQDGCSFSCAFCVIPQVRGASRSRAAEAVLTEVRRRIAQGHREVVLTGINLGCYRDRAARFDLARLVREVGAIPGLERLRLSSIEVNHLTEDLVAALGETAKASPHLHVPLQSGDDGVLAAMGRRYTSATYVRRVARAKGFNLTADVIVGFPAEDDAAFERTLAVVEEAGLTKVHVFPYSPRPGTRTAAADSVPPAVKKERSARLRALSAELCVRRWHSKVGAEDDVLVDRPGRGYGDDYTPWLVNAPVGSLVRARAVDVSEEGVVGAQV